MDRGSGWRDRERVIDCCGIIFCLFLVWKIFKPEYDEKRDRQTDRDTERDTERKRDSSPKAMDK